jgi:hypothetical protein
MYIPVRVINFTFVTNPGNRFVTKVKSITLTGIYIS